MKVGGCDAQWIRERGDPSETFSCSLYRGHKGKHATDNPDDPELYNWDHLNATQTTFAEMANDYCQQLVESIANLSVRVARLGCVQDGHKPETNGDGIVRCFWCKQVNPYRDETVFQKDEPTVPAVYQVEIP